MMLFCVVKGGKGQIGHNAAQKVWAGMGVMVATTCDQGGREMLSDVPRFLVRERLLAQWPLILAVVGGPALFACVLLVIRDTGSISTPSIPPIFTLAPSSPPTATSDLIGRASVIDGDTIEIHGRRIRLNGIDAPESSQTCEVNGKMYQCGQRASFALADFIAARTVSCQQTGTDRYRRAIAKCFAAETDLGRWMVSQGWAIAYRRYSLEYVDAEESARSSKAGIWAGSFVEPEQWRHRKVEKTNGK
jgi:endonuclease YncB( thermonuclease family)